MYKLGNISSKVFSGFILILVFLSCGVNGCVEIQKLCKRVSLLYGRVRAYPALFSLPLQYVDFVIDTSTFL